MPPAEPVVHRTCRAAAAFTKEAHAWDPRRIAVRPLPEHGLTSTDENRGRSSDIGYRSREWYAEYGQPVSETISSSRRREARAVVAKKDRLKLPRRPKVGMYHEEAITEKRSLLKRYGTEEVV